ncbi:MAG: FAD-dependent oxidoreductase [Lachnospiraceae bacterium]|nr:FAD-dependent oxidoreductase [Lachnospiraceae bacterium]
MNSVVILGAGIAGISAAYHLKKAGIESVIYEQDDGYGGLCRSFQVDGFTFDTFAHISFASNTKEYLENTTEHYTHASEALNFDNGIWLRHPVQNNMVNLPVEERIRLIKGFIEKKNDGEAANYAQWLESVYGIEFAHTYPFRYTRKYWTVEPEQLETKWVKGRMYEPRLEEVLRGAMMAHTPGVHYSKEARYPKYGGFQSFLSFMAKECNIIYQKKVCRIDSSLKKIGFADGTEVHYEHLISTLPINEVCGFMADAPEGVKNAADHLDYTSGVMVSLGINRPKVSPALWFYIYDEDIFPARIYSPDWKSPNNVPSGCSALQAEIYYSKYKPLTKSLDEVMEEVIEQLLKLKLFDKNDIIIKDVRMKKYANIMFTPNTYRARDEIHSFLSTEGIFYAGRFGEWDYLWVGQSLLSGKRAAENMIDSICG